VGQDGDGNDIQENRDLRILFGSSTGLDESARSVSLFSSRDFMYQSTSLSGLGDINGDGVDDFAIGEPDSDLGGGFNDNEGRAFLIFGGTDFMDGVENADVDELGTTASPLEGYIVEGVNQRDGVGNAISVADVNGDGINDVIIAANGADNQIINIDQVAFATSAYDGTVPYFSGGGVFVVFGSDDLSTFEAADNADGANDNVINVASLPVDVLTGELPIVVSVANSGFTSFQSEGLTQAVSFDY